MTVAERLAGWATGYRPDDADLALARRSLVDTVAVTVAAHDHPIVKPAQVLDRAGRWAAIGHVLDFDDLHVESTTHISVVCVPTALATGGGARGYLVGAGVLARLGDALGWEHYSAGWHATCTAGAIGAAAGAAAAMELDAERIATAMALAVPGAGGVQRAFGTDGKSLQVGCAVDTGIRAARLAAAGASADPAALDQWLGLVGGRADRLLLDGPAVPGGLAVKLYPCCYALQRPISALGELRDNGLEPGSVTRIEIETLAGTIAPLLHHRPRTGLQGKFSLEYAVATALLDSYQGFDAFSDDGVGRTAATRLVELVDVHAEPGGTGLLDGEFRARVHTDDGDVRQVSMTYPPGSPNQPADADLLQAKLRDCTRGLPTDPTEWTWQNAGSVLEGVIG
ncbi:MAG TPA: MmgE/PrpD family protein [Pseudonocardiaceae bacterium]|nr:MmgE/PrpD family protein [Pseudonocardiaceae bacterium]